MFILSLLLAFNNDAKGLPSLDHAPISDDLGVRTDWIRRVNEQIRISSPIITTRSRVSLNWLLISGPAFDTTECEINRKNRAAGLFKKAETRMQKFKT